MTAPSPPPAFLVTTEAAPDLALAVLVRDGRADLDAAALLRGPARELALALGPAPDEEAAARWLRARGAPDEAAARADARRFLAELAGLAAAERSAAPASGAATSPAPGAPAELDAPEAWTHLARGVLARGHRLRFRAHGRSMRPLVPHGSRLEVEPRPFARVRLGEVVLHAAPRAPLVAHRAVGRTHGELVLRGDSNARLDRVPEREYLGVVVARERGGRWRSLTSLSSRLLGLTLGLAYHGTVAATRVLLLRPLRGTYARPSLLRAVLRAPLRVLGGLLVRLERAAVRARRPVDVLRAALLSTAEKDGERARLYRGKAIQDFTAQEENVRSGLTLLEEVLLARHPLAGRVLVLGCGPGREALVLARRGCAVTGLDREAGMLARARELAQAAGLAIEYREGEATAFQLAGEPFDAVVVFSGLYNMVQPRARRVALLGASRAHLRPGGRVLLTYLVAYRWPGAGATARGKHLLEALNPEHERGDQYLLNESIHVFPQDEDVASEARAAGLEVVELFRDQRAYDRPAGQVRGYAVLRRPLAGA
ncbi:MAG TPA: class I SAM-dependent methyltransferase [Planctomycetota bacterium]